jgi:hypothetical protein
MFNLIKVAAVGVAMTLGVANMSHADGRGELCMAGAEAVVGITDLINSGVLPETILRLMVGNGVPQSMAEEMIVFTYIGYTIDERPVMDVAYDWYLNCMSEGV